MVPDRNPWKEIYMEIYHKNKDQHDKGLSDEVLKDLLELQRINKIEPKKNGPDHRCIISFQV